MELLKLPPNLQFYPAKLKLNPQFLCRKTQRLSVQSALKKLRVRSEFNGKSNGALSGDTDPRLIDRQKALEAAMHDINSSFGKGSVTRLGSAGGALVETFPSGCLTLDFALGGGLPKGRIVEAVRPLMAEGITQASPYNARYPTLPEQEEEFFEEVQ